MYTSGVFVTCAVVPLAIVTGLVTIVSLATPPASISTTSETDVAVKLSWSVLVPLDTSIEYELFNNPSGIVSLILTFAGIFPVFLTSI